MSLGGPIANWLLVLLVVMFIPLNNAGRAALFTITFGRAVSVCYFEVPVIQRVLNGTPPDEALEARLNSGALDKGGVYGYLITALVWIIAV